jgi:hypothetical protein
VGDAPWLGEERDGVKYIRPRNWREFQHYKERAPVWIKLHRRLLDDYDFNCLPVASQALAPKLWLLASEYDNGDIPADTRKIAYRLRMTLQELSVAFEPLLRSGFFEIIGNDDELDSVPLAETLLIASPEKREQVTSLEEKETLSDLQSDQMPTSKPVPKPKAAKPAYPSDFEEFWKDYPTDKNMAKLTAFKAWGTLSDDDRRAAIAAVQPYKTWISKQKDYRTLHAVNFLKQRRFDGFRPAEVVDAVAARASKDKADRMLRRGKYAPDADGEAA